MRAVRLLRFGTPLVDIDIGEREPRPGDVRVEIRAVGICHSDAHYRGGHGRVTLPLTLGHEIAGLTDSGERVAVHYLLPDGSMFGKEVDGGYAETIVVPRDNLVPIPDQVPFEQAAVMMCSTATAYHALRLASLQPGESVAILGFGGLGASAVQLAHGLGAGDIFAVDRVWQKRERAQEFGAIPISGELPPIDIALDFVGNADLCRAALRALKPGGRLMIVAINLRALSFDPYADVLVRERRIIGVSDHTREELVELMELARAGRIDLSRVITRRVALNAAAINEVLDDLDRGTAHLRTVVEVARGIIR